ncbi:hypothetical protein N7512_002519 [Penicillium capsulatum]|nr:hypothetical protein N7512_002519 [Penicillium capsulatum]
MAIDSRDLDGDSEMASSADSVHSDSDGVRNGAHTPTNARVTSAAAASELSPPGSQSQTIPGISAASDLHAMDPGPGQIPSKGSDGPAAAYKRIRAQEEYDRAMEFVIDKDFNLNEFGDPFDERDMEQKLF